MPMKSARSMSRASSSVSGVMRRKGLSLWSTLGLAVLLLASGQQQAQACGLEPMINGGFSVSHPASLGVALAVANARRDGLLPEAGAAPPNDVQLNRMLADLRKLQARLEGGRKVMTERPQSFSLVLVGPGLWSHFYASPSNILARYHTTGPLDGKTSVITHHVVLKSLLDGSLTAEEAVARGLLTYSDGDAVPIRQLFETALHSS